MPDELSLSENYNVLKIAEIHSFEVLNDAVRKNYISNIAEQVNKYDEFYDVDELWILGDSGSYDDTYELLDNLKGDFNVKLVAGDEDKEKRNVKGRKYTGWYRQINSVQPFNVDIEYEIFDEGFETKINDTKIQAAHHPSSCKRSNELKYPDPRSDKFLEDLFSIHKEDNENSLHKVPPPSMKKADMFFYDHVHMPYPRTIGGKAVVGLGARRNNHQRKSEVLPDRSLHMSSFGDRYVHELHFDADLDSIFEHVAFDTDKEYEMLNISIEDEGDLQEFKLLQERFKRDQFNDEAWEEEADRPNQLEI